MMGFNPLNMVVGAATGFLTGGPVGAAIGGVAGATGSPSNLTSTVGNLGNSASSGWQSGILALQDAQNMQNALYSLQINAQASQFNNMMDEKSEMMRESNTLRDVALEQKKADTQITKKFIESIL
jgi:uncharacterized transporter YbjL